MGDYYINRGNQKLRCGFTTGSCAAAAAKAAAVMLATQSEIDKIQLTTPAGIVFEAKIENAFYDSESACCAVRKDGGDDPDITDGILIYAKVCFINSGIVIEGGDGIGRVTKAGLDQPVGGAAINSTPRRMIAESVEEVLNQYGLSRGARVIIYAPQGKDIAIKTYNPRMGIEGGISIIGTTGIVEPMSNSALLETIRLEERIRRAEGKKSLLLTLGNYSRSFLAGQMPFMLDKCVTCSNFIGDAIDAAMEYGFENILIIGHIGKLVKLGAGIFNTHSAQADGRMEVLVTCGLLAGADADVLRKLPDCPTVDAALDVLESAGMKNAAAGILMKRAQYYLESKVKGGAKIGAVMFSFKHGIVGSTDTANELIKIISEEYNNNG